MNKGQTRKILHRHWHIMNNRKNAEIKTIVDSNGHTIALNFLKRKTIKGGYVNEEYQRELKRSGV